MKFKASISSLQITIGIGTILYIFVIGNSFYKGTMSMMDSLDIVSIFLLLLFIIGFILSWKKKVYAGVALMIWNLGIWVYDFLLIGYQSDGEPGMRSLVLSPVMIIGAFLVLEWYTDNKHRNPSEALQWRFVLRVLLVNYAVLYCIVVISNLSNGRPINYFEFPYTIFLLWLLVFATGFVLSWKMEFVAGLIFILWFVLVLIGNFTFPEITRTGPWFIYAVPILVQGIFHIKRHYLVNT